MRPWQVRDSGESHTWPMSTEENKTMKQVSMSGTHLQSHCLGGEGRRDNLNFIVVLSLGT